MLVIKRIRQLSIFPRLRAAHHLIVLSQLEHRDLSEMVDIHYVPHRIPDNGFDGRVAAVQLAPHHGFQPIPHEEIDTEGYNTEDNHQNGCVPEGKS